MGKVAKNKIIFWPKLQVIVIAIHRGRWRQANWNKKMSEMSRSHSPWFLYKKSSTGRGIIGSNFGSMLKRFCVIPFYFCDVMSVILAFWSDCERFRDKLDQLSWEIKNFCFPLKYHEWARWMRRSTLKFFFWFTFFIGSLNWDQIAGSLCK